MNYKSSVYIVSSFLKTTILDIKSKVQFFLPKSHSPGIPAVDSLGFCPLVSPGPCQTEGQRPARRRPDPTPAVSPSACPVARPAERVEHCAAPPAHPGSSAAHPAPLGCRFCGDFQKVLFSGPGRGGCLVPGSDQACRAQRCPRRAGPLSAHGSVAAVACAWCAWPPEHPAPRGGALATCPAWRGPDLRAFPAPSLRPASHEGPWPLPETLSRAPGALGPLPLSIQGDRGAASGPPAAGPVGWALPCSLRCRARPPAPTLGLHLASEPAEPGGADRPLSGSSLAPGPSCLNRHPFCFARSSRTSGTASTAWT